MCFFVTIAVPAKQANRIPEAFGRGFQILPTANASVLSVLATEYTACLITCGMCSCDLYRRPHTSVAADSDEHLQRKYASRGWSQAKIARAVKQAKEHNRSAVTWSGLRGDVIERLRSLCEAAGAIAVVVHWYSGDVESERMSLKRSLVCECCEFEARASTLPEDEVLFVKSPRLE